MVVDWRARGTRADLFAAGCFALQRIVGTRRSGLFAYVCRVSADGAILRPERPLGVDVAFRGSVLHVGDLALSREVLVRTWRRMEGPGAGRDGIALDFSR